MAEKTEKVEKKAVAKKPAAKPAAKAKKPAAPKAKKAEKVEAPVAPEVEHAQPEVVANAFILKDIGSETFYAVGKRKTAVAQVLVSSGTGKITVNELTIEAYFGTQDLVSIVMQPLTAVGVEKNMTIRAKTKGGGIHAQAEAIRHGISKAIVNIDPDSRRTLKKLGFLTRDSRVKERKKPGLRRARRAPQFSKR